MLKVALPWKRIASGPKAYIFQRVSLDERVVVDDDKSCRYQYWSWISRTDMVVQSNNYFDVKIALEAEGWYFL